MASHAEVNAIASVKIKSFWLITLYVSLEPCWLWKNTSLYNPIIKHKISELYWMCDTNKKWVERDSCLNCRLCGGCWCEEELCSAHHRRFFTFQNKKRPYIILNGRKQNGYIAPLTDTKNLLDKHATITAIGTPTAFEEHDFGGWKYHFRRQPKVDYTTGLRKKPHPIVVDHKGNLLKSAAVFDDKAQTIVHPWNIDFKKNTTIVCTTLRFKNTFCFGRRRTKDIANFMTKFYGTK